MRRVRSAILILAVALATIGATAQPASAFTWLSKLCVGFTACNNIGMGNAGYQNEYLQSHWGMYGGHNCTNYAAYRLIQNGVPNPNFPAGQGSAYNWANIAGQRGYVTDKNPRIGDIAWFSSTSGVGADGHVAYVESIDPAAGKVRVSEDNYGGDFDWRDYYITDVSGFIHFGGGRGEVGIALQANTGYLWILSPGPNGDMGLGMDTLSSPSIAILNDGRVQGAFQANTHNLWLRGQAATTDMGLGMAPKTSPSIAGGKSGGFRVAFQANTGNLFVYDSVAGTRDLGLGMSTWTSPAIAALANGGYQGAFQANTGRLWVAGDSGTADTGLVMAKGSSPSIAASPSGGYLVAFQGANGNLWFFSPQSGARDAGLGMMYGTSPSVTALAGSGYESTFQANTGYLWVAGDAGTRDLRQGMMAGTSPAIAGAQSGGYRVVFMANTGNLFDFTSDLAVRDLGLGMMSATTPCISSILGGGCAPASKWISVASNAPSRVDGCGTVKDTYTVPAVTGVEYLAGGALKAAGTYPTGGVTSLTITARAKPGYVLTGTTTWTLSWTTTVCTTTVTGAALSTPTWTLPKATLTWTATGAPAGTTLTYDVQYRSVTLSTTGTRLYSTPTTWYTHTTTKTGTISGTAGGVYQIQARTTDQYGTIGAWSPWTTVTMPIDDRATSFGYTGTWTAGTSTSYYGGTYKLTSTPGAKVTVTAWTDQVSVIGARSTTSGKATITIDGVLKATIDTYSATAAYRQTLATITIPYGKHTITITNQATTGRPRLILDALAFRR